MSDWVELKIEARVTGGATGSTVLGLRQVRARADQVMIPPFSSTPVAKSEVARALREIADAMDPKQSAHVETPALLWRKYIQSVLDTLITLGLTSNQWATVGNVLLAEPFNTNEDLRPELGRPLGPYNVAGDPIPVDSGEDPAPRSKDVMP